MKNLTFRPILLLSILSGISANSFQQKKVDLCILKIEEPDYFEGGSNIYVIIKNCGKTDLTNITVRAWDLDISVEEGIKEWNLSAEEYAVLEENKNLAEDGAYDYDEDWSDEIVIPNLKKGEKMKLTFFADHWIYDSNAEVGVHIDPENKIKEIDEDNNRLAFIAGG